MGFFTANKAILLLNKNGMYLFIKSRQPQHLTFPSEAIKHQEIIDRRLFENTISEFFKQLKKHNAILLLAEDILFQKQLPLTASPDDVQAFYDTIPFSHNIVAKKIIKTTQNIYLLGTNRDLFQTIVFIARQYIWEIKEVVPITIFLSYLQGHEISYQVLNDALKHKEFIDLANLLKEENTMQQENKQQHTTSFKQYLILIGSVLFFLAALAAAAINLGLLPFK